LIFYVAPAAGAPAGSAFESRPIDEHYFEDLEINMDAMDSEEYNQGDSCYQGDATAEVLQHEENHGDEETVVQQEGDQMYEHSYIGSFPLPPESPQSLTAVTFDMDVEFLGRETLEPSLIVDESSHWTGMDASSPPPALGDSAPMSAELPPTAIRLDDYCLRTDFAK